MLKVNTAPPNPRPYLPAPEVHDVDVPDDKVQDVDVGDLAQPGVTAPAAGPAPQRKAVFPAGWFTVLAVELFLLATLLGFYVVAVQSWPELFSWAPTLDKLLWAGLQVAVFGLAAGSAVMALVSLNRGWRGPAVLFLVATVMYGLVILGALGAARLTATQPQWDAEIAAALEAHRPQQPAELDPPPKADLLGDPELGVQLYMASCASCHGRQGEGVAGVSLSLLDSPFMLTASDQEMLDVILEGRAPDAPDNVTGRPMPVRGGNPFLTDAQGRDIAAFLRQLIEAEESETPLAVDAEQLVPGWVVPPASDGPAGLNPDAVERIAAVPPPPARLSAAFAGMFAGLGVVHVSLGMALAAWLWVRLWQGPRTEQIRLLARACCLCWAGGAVGWLIIIPLMFQMG